MGCDSLHHIFCSGYRGSSFVGYFGTYLVNRKMTHLNPWSEFHCPEYFWSHMSCWNIWLWKMVGQEVHDRKSDSSTGRYGVIHCTASSNQLLRFCTASYSVHSEYSEAIMSLLQHQHLRKLCNEQVFDAYSSLSTSYFHSQNHCGSENSCRQ